MKWNWQDSSDPPIASGDNGSHSGRFRLAVVEDPVARNQFLGPDFVGVHACLQRLDQVGIHFVTVLRRGIKLVRRAHNARPTSARESASPCSLSSPAATTPRPIASEQTGVPFAHECQPQMPDKQPSCTTNRIRISATAFRFQQVSRWTVLRQGQDQDQLRCQLRQGLASRSSAKLSRQF